MIKKQTVTIIIAAVVIALLAVVYFTLIAPMLRVDTQKEIPELLEGEGYNPNTEKILIFPSVEKEDIKKLEIHNEHGDYSFYQGTNGEFYITDYEATPYDSTLFAYLCAAARLPVAIDRITKETSTPEIYGLDKASDPAYYILTDVNGVSHKIFIGDYLPTGGGYYAMYEGRAAVYALDTSTEYILKSCESYVSPILSMPTASEDYYQTERFTLAVDGEPYISVEYMDEAERTKTASTSYYKMVVPENYVPSASNYDEILKTFNNFVGSQVMRFGPVDEAMKAKDLKEYGLDEPKYEIYYRYNDIDNYVLVSKQNEDGSYYAYSVMFNIVARVEQQTLKFLNWNFIDFIDKPMFQKNINDIESIEIKGKDVHEVFNITGTDTTLTVTPKSTLTPFTPQQLDSFKKLYIKLLSLSLENYTESKSKDEWAMTFTVKTRGGVEYVYDFYNYSTRRCYFTINGEGEFYVLRDRVEKILSDTALLMNGGVLTNELS